MKLSKLLAVTILSISSLFVCGLESNKEQEIVNVDAAEDAVYYHNGEEVDYCLYYNDINGKFYSQYDTNTKKFSKEVIFDEGVFSSTSNRNHVFSDNRDYYNKITFNNLNFKSSFGDDSENGQGLFNFNYSQAYNFDFEFNGTNTIKSTCTKDVEDGKFFVFCGRHLVQSSAPYEGGTYMLFAGPGTLDIDGGEKASGIHTYWGYTDNIKMNVTTKAKYGVYFTRQFNMRDSNVVITGKTNYVIDGWVQKSGDATFKTYLTDKDATAINNDYTVYVEDTNVLMGATTVDGKLTCIDDGQGIKVGGENCKKFYVTLLKLTHDITPSATYVETNVSEGAKYTWYVNGNVDSSQTTNRFDRTKITSEAQVYCRVDAGRAYVVSSTISVLPLIGTFAEPTIKENFLYDGEVHEVEFVGQNEYMHVDYLNSETTGVSARSYKVVFELEPSYAWAEGSDGIVYWFIGEQTIQTITEEGEDPTVIVEREEGIDPDILVEVEVIVETEVESANTMVDYNNIQVTNKMIKLNKNEKVGVIFDVKLYRTIDGIKEEIQPSDITPGAIIKVKMLIPEDVNMNRVTRILHVHSETDIESYTFDKNNYKDGYYAIEVDRLSEFAFIYKDDSCDSHWWVLISFIIFGIIILGSLIIPSKAAKDYKPKENENAFMVWLKRLSTQKLIQIPTTITWFIVFVVQLFVAGCGICAILLILEAIVLIILSSYIVLPYTKKLSDKFDKWVNKQKESHKEKPNKFVEIVDKVLEGTAKGLISAVNFAEDFNNQVTLSDALKDASASIPGFTFNKAYVCEYLQKKYKGVAINTRANYVNKTKLPLPDTHYATFNNNGKVAKSCFIYVYELESKGVLLLVKNKNACEKLAKVNKNVKVSAFPIGGEWLAVPINSSYALNDVHAIIDEAYEAVLETLKNKSAKATKLVKSN